MAREASDLDGLRAVSAFMCPLLWLTLEMLTSKTPVAGALESLSAMAQAHLELGVASPFLVCLCKAFYSSSLCDFMLYLAGSCLLSCCSILNPNPKYGQF